jgi:hypothetical protein
MRKKQGRFVGERPIASLFVGWLEAEVPQQWDDRLAPLGQGSQIGAGNFGCPTADSPAGSTGVEVNWKSEL